MRFKAGQTICPVCVAWVIDIDYDPEAETWTYSHLPLAVDEFIIDGSTMTCIATPPTPTQFYQWAIDLHAKKVYPEQEAMKKLLEQLGLA